MTTQFEAETSFTMHCWARMAVDDDTVVHEVCSTQRVLQRVEDHAYRPNHPGDAESVQGTPALVGLLEQPSERDESVKWLSSTERKKIEKKARSLQHLLFFDLSTNTATNSHS